MTLEHPMRRACLAAAVILLGACERAADPIPDNTVSFEIVSGGATQTAQVGTAVAAVPTVRVTDASGDPIAGRFVAFAITVGTGQLGQSMDTTDAAGLATPGSWTLGGRAGPQQLMALVVGITTEARAIFPATATPGPATQLIATPAALSVAIGDTAKVSVEFRDAIQNVIAAGPAVVFTSTAPAVATVSASGLVDGISPGSALVIAASGAMRDTVAVSVSAGAPTVAVESFAIGPTHGIGISDVGRIAYLTIPYTPKLWRFDLVTKTVTDSVLLGCNARDVTFLPSGTLAYVACDALSVLVVDVATNTVLRGITLPGTAVRVLASPDGNWVYATTQNGYVTRISTASDALTWVVAPGALNGIALSPDGAKLYATSQDVGGLYQINTATFTLVQAAFPVATPLGIVVSPEGDRIFVARLDGLLDVRRTSDFGNTTFATGISYAFSVGRSPDGWYLAVATPVGDRVAIIDSRTFQLYQSIPVSSPRRMAVDPTTGALWVTGEGNTLTRIVF